MSHPRLTGTRKDGRGYVVNAVKAIQDVAHPTTVELREIDGDVAMADDSRHAASAPPPASTTTSASFSN